MTKIQERLRILSGAFKALHPEGTGNGDLADAIDCLDAMEAALRLTLDHLERNVGIIYGPGHDIPMAAGAELVRRECVAAVAKLEKSA